MAKVERIQDGAAFASLLEYNKIEAVIFFSNEDEVTVGRTSLFRVSKVTTDNLVIVLDRSPPSMQEIWSCERRFLKARHVHNVLFSVAEEQRINLKRVYKRLKWPSYEQMNDLYKEDWFLSSDIDSSFKKFLLDRIKLMTYNSWRIIEPSVLQACFLIQLIEICWAIALVRQLEAYLKLNHCLPVDSYLSVHDLVNKAVDRKLLGADGSILSLTRLSKIIQEGLVENEVCPLTNRLDGGSERYSGSVHKVDKMKVIEEEYHIPDEFVAPEVLKHLKSAPVTCSVLLFPSYEKNLNRDIIYEPTTDEINAYKEDKHKGRNLDVHVMLCTGSGVDRRGKEYFEFQNSTGDVNAVDFGYVKFAQNPNTIIEYVVLKDYRAGDLSHFDSDSD